MAFFCYKKHYLEERFKAYKKNPEVVRKLLDPEKQRKVQTNYYKGNKMLWEVEENKQHENAGLLQSFQF